MTKIKCKIIIIIILFLLPSTHILPIPTYHTHTHSQSMFSIIFSSLLSDKISRSCQCHVTTTLVTTRTHRDDDTLLVTDDDECALGTHNCGQTRECRNTPGSFRCINKRCPPGYRLNYRSGQCEEVQCGQGMKADHSGSCVGKSGES